MKIFSLFCVLFLLESAWGVSDSFERVTGNYTSVFGDELEYHLTKTTNDTHSDRLFVFIPGDGDNCTERENYYKKSLEAWEALAGEYVESGDWVFPEATIDRYCEVRANTRAANLSSESSRESDPSQMVFTESSSQAFGISQRL